LAMPPVMKKPSSTPIRSSSETTRSAMAWQ
jgi:hypothetical protein